MRTQAFFVVALVVAACSHDESVRDVHYDQSCTADADCANVVGVDVNGGRCSEVCGETVNRREQSRFEADVENRVSGCTESALVDCQDLVAVCVAGRCKAEEPDAAAPPSTFWGDGGPGS